MIVVGTDSKGQIESKPFLREMSPPRKRKHEEIVDLTQDHEELNAAVERDAKLRLDLGSDRGMPHNPSKNSSSRRGSESDYQ